jgi:hypothetical protein
MALRALTLQAVLLFCTPAWSMERVGQTRDYGCNEWRRCRELALAAAARGEYETFHDLAWRAVQTGPQRDPDLMYLLARAQSLSGRPRDALVMLDRLADMGVAPDAAIDDFSRARELAGWSELAAKLEVIRQSGQKLERDPPPASEKPAVSAVTAAAAAPVLAKPPAALRLDGTEAVRFSTSPFSVSGLAYDAVSGRFVFGDRSGRRLVAVDERSSRAMDLVRAESAGFHDVAAMEIDPKRGDLWVASVAGSAARLHRLHLASGRPLRVFDLAIGGARFDPIDLAIGPDGAVMVLDRAAAQLVMLRPGATSPESVMVLDVEDVSSVAAGGDERTAYVAYRDGLLKIDLRARRSTRVGTPPGLSLGRIERLGWRGGALFAVAIDPAGARRAFRLSMDAAYGAIAAAEALEVSLPAGRQLFVTIAGDELLYVLDASPGAADTPARDADPARDELLTFRVPLP